MTLRGQSAQGAHGNATSADGEWLFGGGELGALIRETDWSRTPLGPREQWPASLRTTVGIVVECQFPMALLWSRDLILLYNDAYRVIAADKHPGALGRSTRDVWAEVWHINAPIFAAVLDRGETIYLDDELFPIDRHGRREDAHFTLCYSPVRIEGGAVGGALVTLLETTRGVRERDVLRAERAQSESLYRALFEAIDEGFCIFEVLFDEASKPYDYRFIETNPAFEKQSGLAHAQGKTIRELVPENEAYWFETYGQIALTRRPVRFQSRSAQLGRWFDIFAFPLGDPADRRVAALFTDITERKLAEEALREADRNKDEFLAVLSHELRNPLAPIRNSVFILEHAPPGGEQATRARRIIDRQVQHMTRLVEDLLDVTRISRGKIPLQWDRIDLCALVRGAAEDHREVFARNGVELQVDVSAEPLWTLGDATRLAQVVGNLLHNAAKFTPRGGHATLSVGVSPEGAGLIRVRDDGAGMSPATLAHAFEPFVQDAQGLARSLGGLGLGLALVKGLVGLHGGAVAAASEGEGRGSELTVTLPLLSAPAPPERVVVPAGPRPAVMQRVLVIEDNVDAAESLREALELGPREVAIANTGPDGIAAARAFKPDVVVCDIGLPGLDGYGVARALRADPDPRLRSSYLVALSGYAFDEDVARALQAGFDRHLAKPPSLEALEALLVEAMERAAPG